MTTKEHFTSAATFTPPAAATRMRLTVAAGAGANSGFGAIGGPGAILAAIVDAAATVVSPGSIAGGAAGTGASNSGGAGGKGSTAGGIIAGAGSGAAYLLNGLAGGAPGVDAPGDTSGNGGGQGGKADGTGGAGGSRAGFTSGAAGQSHGSGGAGGKGANGSGSGFNGGGGGGGFGGGGGGAAEAAGNAAPGAGGSSSAGSTSAVLVGYNSGAAYVDVEVAAAPLIPTLLSPVGNVFVDRTQPIMLQIAHNGATADPLDAETHWSIQYRAVGSDTWILVEADGTANVATIAANTLMAGLQYEWRAWTNADGIEGAKSAITTFRASNPPTDPVITSPADSSILTDINFDVDWTSVGQLEWQARLIGDASGMPNPGVIYDSAGAVSGALTTPLHASTNSVAAHVQVRIRDVSGGLWSAWVSHAVTIAWAGPVAPVPFTSSDSANGLTNIGWAQPTTTVDVDHYRITAVENGTTRTVISAVDPASREAIDHIPLSGVETEYHVIAYAVSGAFTDSTTGWSD